MAKRPSDLSSHVLALLQAERVELRCAAALVLGAVGKGDARVGQALSCALGDDDPMVQRFVLEALGTMGVRGMAAKLVPLLESTDHEVRTRALGLLGREGKRAEASLRKELARGTLAARRLAATELLKIGSAHALDALFAELADPDLGEYVLQGLRAEIDRGDAELRATCRKVALSGWKKLSPKVKDDAQPELGRLANLLRLMGYLADPDVLPALLAEALPARPWPIRLAAVAALRRTLASPVAAGAKDAHSLDAAVTAMIAYAGDRDERLARAAVDTLRGARISPKLSKKFAVLAQAKHPEARRLAVERMSTLGAAAAIPSLIASLLGDDPGSREAASRALAATPEAASPVLHALIDAEAEPVARRLASVLRAHERRAARPDVQALARRAAGRLGQAGDVVATVLLEALGRLDAEAHAEVVLGRAATLRKAGKIHDAFAVLRPLLQGGARLSDDQRFFVGVLGVKAIGKDLLRSARSVDPVLQQFATLAAEGYPVAKSLLQQKDVELADLFTLGFNFSESQGDTERELGRELLGAVVAKQPRGKLGVAAKNKLKLVRG
jgi:hypothetical protein